LPSDAINCIVRDSHGFLWFCTPEGLSRFDGHTFTNFGPDRGLPNRSVADFLETRDGELWVGTAAGLSHLRPHKFRPGDPAGIQSSSAGLFEVYRLPGDPQAGRP
jgi:ligand-binding sensor domain-containing protein